MAFSFRTGVFNIGAEGQFVVGSLAATVIGMFVRFRNNYSSALFTTAAAAAGAVWSAFLWSVKGKNQ